MPALRGETNIHNEMIKMYVGLIGWKKTLRWNIKSWERRRTEFKRKIRILNFSKAGFRCLIARIQH